MPRRCCGAARLRNASAREDADARPDDGLAADDLVADPACGPLPRRHRDRLAHDRRTDPPLHLPRRAPPRAPARPRARRAWASRRASASARSPGTAIATSSSTTRVSGMGAVIHTINPRLFLDQLAYIVNHAEDRLVFFDLTFLPLVEKLAPHCPGVTTWIALTDRAHMPQSALAGPALLRGSARGRERRLRLARVRREHRGRAVLHVGHDRQSEGRAVQPPLDGAARVCRAALPDAKGYSAHSVVLPIVPMFHVNAWGIPYAAPLVGAKLVFPGAGLDGESLYELFESESVEQLGGRADRLARPHRVHEAEQASSSRRSRRRRSAARRVRRR